MRTRAEMKQVAKQTFNRSTGVFIPIAAILIAAGFIASVPNSINNLATNSQLSELLNQTSTLTSRDNSVSQWQLDQLNRTWANGGMYSLLSLQLGLLSIALSLGLAVLQVGLSNVALFASAGGEPTFSQFAAHLKDFGRWLALYVLMLVFVTLWSMLFLIPGIIASYRYRLAAYLMLEDPRLGALEAITHSKRLMKGYKGRLFVLDLSFFWWYLLSGITLSFAGLYVLPYRELTNVQFYRDLRFESSMEGLSITAHAL